MEAPAKTRDGRALPYGIGWFTQTFAGKKLASLAPRFRRRDRGSAPAPRRRPGSGGRTCSRRSHRRRGRCPPRRNVDGLLAGGTRQRRSLDAEQEQPLPVQLAQQLLGCLEQLAVGHGNSSLCSVRWASLGRAGLLVLGQSGRKVGCERRSREVSRSSRFREMRRLGPSADETSTTLPGWMEAKVASAAYQVPW